MIVSKDIKGDTDNLIQLRFAYQGGKQFFCKAPRDCINRRKSHDIILMSQKCILYKGTQPEYWSNSMVENDASIYSGKFRIS